MIRHVLPTSLSSRTSRYLSGIFLLVMAMTGCSDNSQPSSQKESQQNSGNEKQQAAPVGVIKASVKEIGYTEKLPGRVVSYRVAQIRPQVSGIIEERLFEEGSLVEEGQQLYQIDPDRYQADLDLARANLESARAAVDNAKTIVERYDSLADMQALSEQEFDNAKTDLKQAQASVGQAEAEVKTAEINLAFTKVYAPISGFIGPSGVTKGALVTEQQQDPLATIRQMDPVYVDLSQSVKDAQQLKARLIESTIEKKDDTKFTVNLFFSDSGEPYSHRGQLDATDLAVDEQTGAIRLRAVFPNPDNRLLPGAFVRASIKGLASSSALILPQKSVQIGRGGKKHVWVVGSDNKVEQRMVETGVAYEDMWVIESGIEEGEQVVVDGLMNLQNGILVKPHNVSEKDGNQAPGRHKTRLTLHKKSAGNYSYVF